MVGVSWQKTSEILDQMFIKNPAKNMLNDVTIGHWMVVAGYNDSTKEIILIDPGNDTTNEKTSPFTILSYTYFQEIWTGKSNLFVGNGDMITIR